MNFGSIHNYYEPLVIEHVLHTVAKREELSEEALEDIICLTLNQLPPRYVRHDEEMAFYLSIREREKMQREISEAALNAVRTVRERAHKTE